MRPRLRNVLALLIAAVTLLIAGARAAAAHGKEVQIELRCTATDPALPLERRCEATVIATNDGDPVSDARLVLRAVRAGKSDEIGGVPLRFTGWPGHYAGALTLPAYGVWEMTVQVEAPAEGRVQLRQEVLPPTGALSPVGSVRARLVIRFGGHDVANIGALAVHLAGTVALFAATGAVLAGAFVTFGWEVSRYRRRIAYLFPRVVAASFLLLVLSGLYNALYNAPTRAPGLLQPARVAGLPFGEAYLIAFAVKMVLTLMLVLGTGVLAVRLRCVSSCPVSPIAGAVAHTGAPGTHCGGPIIGTLKHDACARLAAMNLVVGGMLLLTVLLIDYLHVLSHAGAFAGGL